MKTNDEIKQDQASLAKSHNVLTIMTGSDGPYISMIFDGPNGLYYDAVGDELFVVTRVSTNALGPVYKIELSDETRVGNLKDHGFNAFLGEF